MVLLYSSECIISGLTSDVPYEFKISAINDMGEGIMSDPSDPIVMDNASTVSHPTTTNSFVIKDSSAAIEDNLISSSLVALQAPAMPDLVSFYTLASLMEGRELSWMKQNDWNANVRNLVVAVLLVVVISNRSRSGGSSNNNNNNNNRWW